MFTSQSAYLAPIVKAGCFMNTLCHVLSTHPAAQSLLSRNKIKRESFSFLLLI